VALFVKARFAYTGRDDRVVPFYLLPQLGGNYDLRGFNDYRFADNNAFMTALEHRWYVFSGLEMALFADAGKTVPQKGGVNFSGLNYSGGIGLRARVRGAVVLRMDVARSREGIRWIWSMSDISRRRF
jgi:outer membrane protein assembly factor BamA